METIQRWLILLRGMFITSLILVSLVPLQPAAAHFGEPYTVLYDQKLGEFTLSMKADPDVGTGTFYSDIELPSSMADGEVTIAIQAVADANSTGPSNSSATGQSTGHKASIEQKIEFDQEGYWTLDVSVTAGNQTGKHQFKVLVTPPFPPWITTMICLAPFLMVGAIWTLTMRRNAMLKQQQAEKSIEHRT
ncbi:hypothetical protein [Herpetosiphon giganteus]|uniref:hypothetical protein n=1 Tax=Herpetosiphon giganteus TaxID=2029754 RepID=UPI00195DBA76|nr:hypothetical protein [Herpetosiphon giganteus]MBM7843888.1 hypothetical protein [Herpetosiphon giganteus]